jgi:hypothetical protein
MSIDDYSTDYSTIEIYCDAASHAWHLIERFAKAGLPGRWGDHNHWFPAPNARTDEGKRLRRPEGSQAPIDETTSAYLGAGITPPATIRTRYNLQCDECGLSVPIREERLRSILNTLGAAGVSSISLPGLAARLQRSVDR